MKKIINPWKGLEGYNCFGCAPNNEAGVKMEFYEDGDEVVSIWKHVRNTRAGLIRCMEEFNPYYWMKYVPGSFFGSYKRRE